MWSWTGGQDYRVQNQMYVQMFVGCSPFCNMQKLPPLRAESGSGVEGGLKGFATERWDRQDRPNPQPRQQQPRPRPQPKAKAKAKAKARAGRLRVRAKAKAKAAVAALMGRP